MDKKELKRHEDGYEQALVDAQAGYAELAGWRSPEQLVRIARALANSELESLRNRVADGYAVVELKLLERLRRECDRY